MSLKDGEEGQARRPILPCSGKGRPRRRVAPGSRSLSRSKPLLLLVTLWRSRSQAELVLVFADEEAGVRTGDTDVPKALVPSKVRVGVIEHSDALAISLAETPRKRRRSAEGAIGSAP